MSFVKFRDGHIGPTVILLVICAVITFALAQVYQITYPVIEQANAKAADEIRRTVLPSGDSFSQITDKPLPDGVSEAYKANNGAGFVFKSGARGFDGTVTFMIGIDKDGNVIGINMFEHNETPGLGTKIGEESYTSRYLGNTDPDSVDGVTGATRTSNALKNSLKQAKSAYEALKGAA